MTYKGVEIDEVTVEMIQEYIDAKHFKNFTAREVFDKYQGNGWRTDNGKGPLVKTLESVVNVYNGKVNPNSSFRKRKAGAMVYRSEEYQHLLQTPEWDNFRRKVLELHHYQCDECGMNDAPLHVHHKEYHRSKGSYIVPWGYFFSEVAVLCKECHQKAHGVRVYNKV